MAKRNGKNAEKRTATQRLGTAPTDAEFQSTRVAPFAFGVIGDSITGYYVSSRRSRSKFGTAMHRFVVDGKPVDVWGSGYLDTGLQEVRSGVLVKATYTGDEDSDKGNPAKVIEVEIAPRHRLTPEELAEAQAAVGTGAPGSGRPAKNADLDDVSRAFA